MCYGLRAGLPQIVTLIGGGASVREYVKLSVEKKLKCDEDLATSSLSKQVAQLVTPISQKYVSLV